MAGSPVFTTKGCPFPYNATYYPELGLSVCLDPEKPIGLQFGVIAEPRAGMLMDAGRFTQGDYTLKMEGFDAVFLPKSGGPLTPEVLNVLISGLCERFSIREPNQDWKVQDLSCLRCHKLLRGKCAPNIKFSEDGQTVIYPVPTNSHYTVDIAEYIPDYVSEGMVVVPEP